MKKDIAQTEVNHRLDEQKNYSGSGDPTRREMKVVSFVTHVPKGVDCHPQIIDYPELNEMLNNGFEIWDVLPSWGSGDNYLVTFVLRKWEKKPQRQPLGFHFASDENH